MVLILILLALLKAIFWGPLAIGIHGVMGHQDPTSAVRDNAIYGYNF